MRFAHIPETQDAIAHIWNGITDAIHIVSSRAENRRIRDGDAPDNDQICGKQTDSWARPERFLPFSGP